VRWDAYEIRFHYPAEHIINNIEYDFEMQIVGRVNYLYKITYFRITMKEHLLYNLINLLLVYFSKYLKKITHSLIGWAKKLKI
jgi:carbonic anhydrase